MKIAYYFIFLVFAVNLASGVVSSMIGPITNGEMGGLTGFDPDHNTPFTDPELQKEIGVAAEAADSSSDSTSIWDLLGLGFVQTWIRTANTYIFGVNGLLYNIFGQWMTNDGSTIEAGDGIGSTYAETPSQKSQLDLWFGCGYPATCNLEGPNKGIIGIIISAMWILAAIGLFVGKNFFED